MQREIAVTHVVPRVLAHNCTTLTTLQSNFVACQCNLFILRRHRGAQPLGRRYHRWPGLATVALYGQVRCTYRVRLSQHSLLTPIRCQSDGVFERTSPGEPAPGYNIISSAVDWKPTLRQTTNHTSRRLVCSRPRIVCPLDEVHPSSDWVSCICHDAVN